MRVADPRRAAVCAVLFGSALLATPAFAGVIRVPTQVTSFRVAVLSAAPGDTIQIVGNGGATYPVTNVVIDKDLTIQGGWRADFRVRDAATYVSVLRDTSLAPSFLRPLLRVNGPFRVEIDGVWLWGGRHGILAENGADLVVRDCVIRSQRNTDQSGDVDANRGGGIRLVRGTALVERCHIHSITTAFSGAALATILSSSVVVRDSRFDNCVASRSSGDASGAAVYARDVADLRLERTTLSSAATVQDGGLAYLLRTPLVAADCTFTQGLASRYGGAFYLDACPSAVFDACTFGENRGIVGGAIRGGAGVALTLRDCRFEKNRAADQGGALWLDSVTWTVERTTFIENQVTVPSIVVPDQGGAVYCRSSQGTVTDTSFLQEKARGKGGALFQIGGETTLTRCRLERNEAGVFGGAVAIELGGSISLDHCLLVRNFARFGGAITASFTGAISLDHCTLAECSGRSAGAGVYVDTGGDVKIRDTILCCALAGDLVYCAGGSVVADHCDSWNDDSVNIREEWGGGCPDPTGTNGNLKADPGFCPGDPDWLIAAASPCVGAASDGGDLGWRPAGCAGAVPLGVEPRSWSRIKAAWRDPASGAGPPGGD